MKWMRRGRQHQMPPGSDLHEEVVQAFVVEADLDRRRRLVESHPELCTEEGLLALRRMVSAARRDGSLDLPKLEDALRLLRRCRTESVDIAFAVAAAELKTRLLLRMPGPPPEKRTENLLLQQAVQVFEANGFIDEKARALATAGQATLDDAVVTGEKAVALLNVVAHARVWARTTALLATVLAERSRDSDLHAAAGLLSDAVRQMAEYGHPDRREAELDLVHALLRLGTALLRGGDHTGVEAMRQLDLATPMLREEDATQWLDSQLRLVDPATRPEAWSRLALRRATDLLQSKSGHRRENLDTAITLIDEILRRTPDAPAEVLLEANRGLGFAYRHRISGDPAENLRLALEHNEFCRALCSPDADPKKWVKIHSEIGSCWRSTRIGDRRSNLDHAATAHEVAWEASQRYALDAELVAEVGNELAMVYSARGAPGDLDRAITTQDEVVKTLSPPSPDWPLFRIRNWVGYLTNLATFRALRDGGDDLEYAISTYHQVLSIYGTCVPPIDTLLDTDSIDASYLAREWATVQFCVGNVLAGSDPDAAIAAYRAAQRVISPTRFPTVAWSVTTSLATVLGSLERWSDAYDVLLSAVSAVDAEFGTAFTDETRESMVARHAGVFGHIVDVCLRMRPPRRVEALLHAEEGRSRMLRDQLTSLDLPEPAGLRQEIHLAFERHMLVRARTLEGQLRDETVSSARKAAVEEAAEVRRNLLGVWETLAADPSAVDYVSMRRGDRPQWSDIQDLLASHGTRTGLLSYYTTPDGILAFVVRVGMDEPVVTRLDVTTDHTAALRKRCQRELHRYSPGWDIGETWQELAHPLVAPILDEMDGVDLLYLIPHGPLHGVPLHAVTCNGVTLLDKCAVAYAPSAMVARRMALTHHAPFGGGAVVVGDATEDLDNAKVEAEAVGHHFGVSPLIGRKATVDAVAHQLASVGLAHFACHAHFDRNDPFSSGIELADGVLTAREIMRRHVTASRIVLSACETAMVDVREGDELFGLSRAFLYAGVSTIIATLWAVDDPATKNIMLAFYDRLSQNTLLSQPGAVAHALREAMLLARDQGAPTHHWAPFVLFGSAA